MKHEEKHVLILLQVEQRGSKRNLAGQVEWPPLYLSGKPNNLLVVVEKSAFARQFAFQFHYNRRANSRDRLPIL